jgi:hypothetical protein
MSPVYWVPTALKPAEQRIVKNILIREPNAQLGGGSTHTTLSTFTLLNRDNVTYTGTLEDAVYHFVKVLRRDPGRASPSKVSDTYMDGVRDAVDKGVGCSCTTTTCTNERTCAHASLAQGNEFLERYRAHLARGTSPLYLSIRRTTPSPRTYNLSVTFPTCSRPSFEDVRHGVIAKMRISRV